jgi:hypothetical protein
MNNRIYMNRGKDVKPCLDGKSFTLGKSVKRRIQPECYRPLCMKMMNFCKQTHSSIISDAWKLDTDTTITGYKFVDNTLETRKK